MTISSTFLGRAARLLALVATSRARRTSLCSTDPQRPLGRQTMTEPIDPEPNSEAKALTAELLDRLTLNTDGQPFDDGDESTWQAADETEPEVVRCGFARFQIIDQDATELALAAGAIDENSPPTLCLRVRFDNAEGEPEHRAGQYIAIDTDAGVKLLFLLWLTGEDVQEPAPAEFGLASEATMRNELLDALSLGEALLVQVIDQGERESA